MENTHYTQKESLTEQETSLKGIDLALFAMIMLNELIEGDEKQNDINESIVKRTLVVGTMLNFEPQTQEEFDELYEMVESSQYSLSKTLDYHLAQMMQEQQS